MNYVRTTGYDLDTPHATNLYRLSTLLLAYINLHQIRTLFKVGKNAKRSMENQAITGTLCAVIKPRNSLSTLVAVDTETLN